tara:strand:- start:309 stop:461 length:153 start_codon:yes stop_codon:yes gene_type:complete
MIVYFHWQLAHDINMMIDYAALNHDVTFGYDAETGNAILCYGEDGDCIPF